LRPGALDNLGLSETLRDAVNYWQNLHPEMTINLSLQGNPDKLGETLNINIYRIVQEAINNALKHAKANIIDIKLAVLADTSNIVLTIKDNGVGMNLGMVDQTQHFGLLGMRERVQGFHGTFRLDSEPNQGTTLCINIPQVREV
jgi:signal transduction histidine kinase